VTGPVVVVNEEESVSRSVPLPLVRRTALVLALLAATAAGLQGCASTATSGPASASGRPAPGGKGGAALGCASPDLVATLSAQRSRLFDAIEQGNRAALEDMLDEGFVFVHASGAVDSRAAFVDRAVKNARTAAAKAGRAIDFADDDIRLHDGRVAVWLSRSSVGRPKSADALLFQSTDVLTLQGGRWRWISMHSARIGPEAWSLPMPAAPHGCAAHALKG
jgi:Spy/CpxP family protein refolding chaperone